MGHELDLKNYGLIILQLIELLQDFPTPWGFLQLLLTYAETAGTFSLNEILFMERC